MQQRAGAEREGEQPLDYVVAWRLGSKGARADAQGRDSVPGRARGALDEGEGGGDGEEQAAKALVTRPEAGGGVAERGGSMERAFGARGGGGAGGGAQWLVGVAIGLNEARPRAKKSRASAQLGLASARSLPVRAHQCPVRASQCTARARRGARKTRRNAASFIGWSQQARVRLWRAYRAPWRAGATCARAQRRHRGERVAHDDTLSQEVQTYRLWFWACARFKPWQMLLLATPVGHGSSHDPDAF